METTPGGRGNAKKRRVSVAVRSSRVKKSFGMERSQRGTIKPSYEKGSREGESNI